MRWEVEYFESNPVTGGLTAIYKRGDGDYGEVAVVFANCHRAYVIVRGDGSAEDWMGAPREIEYEEIRFFDQEQLAEYLQQLFPWNED